MAIGLLAMRVLSREHTKYQLYSISLCPGYEWRSIPHTVAIVGFLAENIPNINFIASHCNQSTR